MTRPSQHELLAEAAEIARRFGWPLDAALDLEHRDRRVLLAVGAGAGAAPDDLGLL
jgi:hypothetical protein